MGVGFQKERFAFSLFYDRIIHKAFLILLVAEKTSTSWDHQVVVPFLLELLSFVLIRLSSVYLLDRNEHLYWRKLRFRSNALIFVNLY